MSEQIQNVQERIEAALEALDDERLARELAEVRAADLAELFDVLDDEERSRVLFALPPHTAAEVFITIGDAVRSDVVEDLNDTALRELVLELTPDDAADVLGDLDKKRTEEILEQIPDERSEKIEALLGYEEDTAGGIMTTDVVFVSADETIADAVDDIRDATQDEELHEIYIVDAEQRPIGVVPLRRMVTHPPYRKLKDICNLDPVTVNVKDDQETVLQVIRKYDVSGVAVVNDAGKLLGRITHDDVLDVAHEEAAEDLFRMAGTDASELETSSVFRAARIRLMWLLPCMVGVLLTASVWSAGRPGFDAVLFGTLVIFAPLIGATGGNAGIQISTVIVRGLATGELGSSRLTRALAREGRIALLMAPVCGVVAWLLVLAVLPLLLRFSPEQGDPTYPGRVALAVGLALTSAVLVAAALGIMLPFTFRKLGVDPAIASGPLVTSTNDVVSIGIYMLIALAIAR